MGGPVALAVILSAAAVVASVVALGFVLTRNADQDPCRTVAWGAVPSAAELPAGWTVVSNRFFVDNATLTIVGAAPSGATEGPAVFVSVSCYGSDASVALARAREGASATGATEKAVRDLGDDAFAVVSATTSTTVYVQRGDLVADVTAPASVDEATLEAVLYAVDTAMVRALTSAGQPPSGTAVPPALASPTPSPVAGGSPTQESPAASPSPTPLSHVAPDLEARLPDAVDGTTLSLDSVTGATALGTDTTSQAFIASLKALGKTPIDLQIARGRDPTGNRPIRLFAFRVQGVDQADLGNALADALLGDATSSPKASQVTLAGRKVKKLTYSQGPSEYLYEAAGGVVFNVETTDESLAEKVLSLLE